MLSDVEIASDSKHNELSKAQLEKRLITPVKNLLPLFSSVNFPLLNNF